MTKKQTLLERMNSAGMDIFVDSLSGRSQITLDEILNPGKKSLAKESDEDLHELISARPGTRESQIAASIIREREAWRTPARWSLIVSAAALAVSAIALLRTF